MHTVPTWTPIIIILMVGNNSELYSDIEGQKLYKTIEEGGASMGEIDLTEDDYAAFSTYRFVFKKNSAGIYSFSAVEKK